MKTEDLRSTIRRYYEEAIDKDDYRVIDELFSKGVELEDPSMGSMHGRDAAKEGLRMYRRIFPDGRSPVEDIIVEGNKVVVRGYRLGTHEADLMGIPPTGKQIRVPFVDIWELRNDEVIRVFSLTDGLGVLRQLGVTHLPEMEPERMAV